MSRNLVRVNYDIYEKHSSRVVDSTYTLINLTEAGNIVSHAIDVVEQVKQGKMTADQAISALSVTLHNNVEDLE